MSITSRGSWRSGRIKKRTAEKAIEEPLLYCKTIAEIEAYRKKPITHKLQWLEAQMEFFHKAMPKQAKKIREKFRQGEI